MKVNCKACSKEFDVKPARLRDGRGKYCSRPCAATRPYPPTHWKGGISIHKDGRVRIWKPNHLNNVYGYVYRDRLVMEEHLGRLLERHELVHHIDRNPSNDSVDNLQVVTRGEHNTIHGFQGNMYIKFPRRAS